MQNTTSSKYPEWLTSGITLLAAVLLTTTLTTSTLAQQPGDLDPSFGSDGRVTTAIGSSSGASSVAIQPDGKIVAVGHSRNGGNTDFAIVRYLPDGSLDTSFGSGGVVITPIGTDEDVAKAVSIQADGKIVVAGRKFNLDTLQVDIALARYNPNGSLDATFGIGGIVVTPIGSSDDMANSLSIQTDGKITVAGTTWASNGTLVFAVVRYNKNGSLDATFGSGGVVITPTGSLFAAFGSVAIQADEKIVAAGKRGNGLSADVTVVRYNANGSLDATFGSGGIVTTPTNSTWGELCNFLPIQPDGKIVAVGDSRSGSNLFKFALVRYNPDGSLDTTFGSGGIVRTLIGEGAFPRSVGLQGDGKLVVSGYGGDSGNIELTLARYNTNGSLDTRFGGGDGIRTFDFDDGSNDHPDTAMALDNQRRAVVAGGSAGRFAVARFLLASQRAMADFDGDGRSDVSVFRPSDRTWYLDRSTEGFYSTQFGISTDKITPADFDGDGKTDISIFRDGMWWWMNSSDHAVSAAPFGQPGDIPVPTDYTGDGRDELAVYRNGQWWTYDLSNNQTSVMNFGLAPDKPVPTDYDGDGRADQAVYRNGQWHLNQSTLGYTVANFGLPTDIPIPADYDGDGKADLAVYRTGTWYLQQSAQGFSAFPFGLLTDIPVPADYDGDSKTDAAVYRDGT